MDWMKMYSYRNCPFSVNKLTMPGIWKPLRVHYTYDGMVKGELFSGSGSDLRSCKRMCELEIDSGLIGVSSDNSNDA